uniref:Uncharacterized protein n=1 Tax=Pyxicephalus adspersus TaxID=30357 RepID=A0AAV2ZZI0_PYXAD|nr:TPA: hypothetical protein GDO54_014930 [Pyxicephalus adspersus]
MHGIPAPYTPSIWDLGGRFARPHNWHLPQLPNFPTNCFRPLWCHQFLGWGLAAITTCLLPLCPDNGALHLTFRPVTSVYL